MLVGEVQTLNSIASVIPSRARVAKWQTRWLQVPVFVRTWGFKSPLAHQLRTCHELVKVWNLEFIEPNYYRSWACISCTAENPFISLWRRYSCLPQPSSSRLYLNLHEWLTPLRSIAIQPLHRFHMTLVHAEPTTLRVWLKDLALRRF